MASKLSAASPIGSVKGIGPNFEEKLSRLNISTVSDLIQHFPTRYLDFTKPVPIRDLRDKIASVFIATLSEPRTFYTATGKLMTQVTAQDDSGKIKLTWFNNPYIKRLIREGDSYTIAGKPSFWAGKLTLISPTIEAGDSLSLNTSGLVPVYHQTEGVTSKWLRSKIYFTLDSLDFPDPVDPAVLQENGLSNLTTAYHQIHFPHSSAEHWVSDKRLSFNEHLRINITNILERSKLGDSLSIKLDPTLYRHSLTKFPFSLTSGQSKAVEEIFSDLSTKEPTHRLVQGETGSGKTVTIILSSDQVINNNFSVAVMAPTEILAQQHFSTFSKFSSFSQNIQLITASTKEKPIVHKPMIYIGTHALLTQIPEKLNHPLALVAIDEQHKFGVRQREELQERAPIPHLLNLSATPIPRTVALGLLGDIESSNIETKPTNRLPTKTHIVDPDRYTKSTDWMSKKLTEGNNIFVVCPNITQKDSGIASVESITLKYQKKYPKNKVYSLHGRLKKDQQQVVLNEFKSTPSSILVATSLIEVGIDIPQANIMVVHSAERFGLAQLHQLRGRVGRGGDQGYFFLVPTQSDEIETERLKLLQKYDSGLTLAQKDLRLRGAGEVFGLKQHGSLPTRLKYFWSKKLFTTAKRYSKALVKNNPEEARNLLIKLSP